MLLKVTGALMEFIRCSKSVNLNFLYTSELNGECVCASELRPCFSGDFFFFILSKFQI